MPSTSICRVCNRSIFGSPAAFAKLGSVDDQAISAFFEGLTGPAPEGEDAETRARNRLLLDKDVLELAMSFDDIEEAGVKQLVLRMVHTAMDASRKKLG